MKKILISVIIPTYNAEKTIDRCIESMLNQTFKEIEIICCDDCSNDNTYNKLKEWQKKDDRIIVLKNKINSKAAFTRNQCIKIAKGKYIAQLDDDDYSFPDRLKKQYDFMETNLEYSIVGSGVVLFDENGIYSKITLKENPEKKDFLKSSIFINPSTMVRKEALNSVNGYRVAKETARGQDCDLWVRMYVKGYKGYNMQENLTAYYRGKSGYKKTNYKIRINEYKMRMANFKLLKLMPIGYIFALKPLIVGLIPFSILEKIKRKLRK